ncbi:MAG: hypothetical protein OEZ39_04465 [Gammaproteobacteria bacterium]|nr:hypothetical protein [Gammaproteobacteria bacterium]MDH5651112.1 hypothetical protein [Gammaproteobacteria bacterium]
MSDEDDIEKALLERFNIKNSEDVTVDVLLKITAEEAKILRNRFGTEIDYYPVSDEMIKQFDLIRTRIKQIEEKALAKLRHPKPNDDN